LSNILPLHGPCASLNVKYIYTGSQKYKWTTTLAKAQYAVLFKIVALPPPLLQDSSSVPGSAR